MRDNLMRVGSDGGRPSFRAWAAAVEGRKKNAKGLFTFLRRQASLILSATSRKGDP